MKSSSQRFDEVFEPEIFEVLFAAREDHSLVVSSPSWCFLSVGDRFISLVTLSSVVLNNLVGTPFSIDLTRHFR